MHTRTRKHQNLVKNDMEDIDFFQSKVIGQDGGEKKSSGSKGNGEKVDEPEGDLKVHIFTNERI